jgi:hypothetical protein
MKDARREISDRMGDQRADKIVHETPIAIIGEGFFTAHDTSQDSSKVGALLRSLKQIKTLVSEA